MITREARLHALPGRNQGSRTPLPDTARRVGNGCPVSIRQPEEVPLAG